MSEVKHNPDQWKSEGECAFCRRVKYCNKECIAHKNAIMKALEEQGIVRNVVTVEKE